jgi:hypothetical protein
MRIWELPCCNRLGGCAAGVILFRPGNVATFAAQPPKFYGK